MRVGIYCYPLQENIGGMRQYFHRLFRELLANDNENSYIFFYFEHNVSELEKLGNDRWKEGAVLLHSQDGVKHHLDKIDIYFCPFGGLWPRPIKVPSVVMIPDIQEKFHPEFFSRKILFDREFYFDASTRIADRVITISNFTKNSIVKYHGVSSDKISVAYLSVDESFVDYAPDDESVVSNLPSQYLFYPANRWLHKNHDNLLKALIVLKNKYDLTVDCVFTGHEATGGYPLGEKIKEYGLEAQIHVLGYLSDNQLKYIFKSANLLCFPSLFEGFGIPVLEAMSLGCPVVCASTSSLPEVAGDAALFFNPSDPDDIAIKIRSLWDNTSLRNELIGLGKQQSGKFSIKKTADVHLNAFKSAKSSFNLVKYYYDKCIYDPLFKIKVKIKHNVW